MIVYTNNKDLCGSVPRVSTFIVSCNHSTAYTLNSILSLIYIRHIYFIVFITYIFSLNYIITSLRHYVITSLRHYVIASLRHCVIASLHHYIITSCHPNHPITQSPNHPITQSHDSTIAIAQSRDSTIARSRDRTIQSHNKMKLRICILNNKKILMNLAYVSISSQLVQAMLARVTLLLPLPPTQLEPLLLSLMIQQHPILLITPLPPS
jgi:hypothetical protein